jgi:hypothetical protein
MSAIKFWSVTAAVFVLSFGGVAFAADAIDPADGSLDIAKAVYNAFAGHHYAYAGALGLILGVALVKRYLGSRIAWLHSDTGGSAMALLASFGAALAASLANGGPATWDLLKSAFLVGVGAAGGYAVLKNLLITPILKPLAAKAPLWMQPLFAMIFWIFDHETPSETATNAGNAAVAATPAQGAAGVTGNATEVK